MVGYDLKDYKHRPSFVERHSGFCCGFAFGFFVFALMLVETIEQGAF